MTYNNVRLLINSSNPNDSQFLAEIKFEAWLHTQDICSRMESYADILLCHRTDTRSCSEHVKNEIYARPVKSVKLLVMFVLAEHVVHAKSSLAYKRLVIYEIIGNYVDLFFILFNHLMLLSIMIITTSTRGESWHITKKNTELV